ncbi:hypothetical protein JCM10213_001629 [Rhodosporidiobolus nylandii]
METDTDFTGRTKAEVLAGHPLTSGMIPFFSEGRAAMLAATVRVLHQSAKEASEAGRSLAGMPYFGLSFEDLLWADHLLEEAYSLGRCAKERGFGGFDKAFSFPKGVRFNDGTIWEGPYPPPANDNWPIRQFIAYVMMSRAFRLYRQSGFVLHIEPALRSENPPVWRE